jgi:N4-gp56 family major capsid protein
MADVLTDGGTAWSNLLATGYDRFLEFQLRSQPIFRQFVDKHPVDVTNPGPTVTLTVVSEFSALATTPLSETADVSAVAPPNPSRITVTVNEYGNANIPTLRLRQLAFTSVDPALAHILGLNMVDTLDALVRTTVDAGTNVIGKNGGSIKTNTNGFAEGSVAAGDTFDSNVARDAVALLRRRNARGRDNRDMYVALIHPDVSVDIMSDSGWLAPHQYSDPQNIYNAEIGAYLGARYVMTPRVTTASDGSASTKVYRTYFWGAQALVEATVADAHTVIGPQTDHLRRFFPMGWLYHGGWAIFRQEALQQARSSSSIAAL